MPTAPAREQAPSTDSLREQRSALGLEQRDQQRVVARRRDLRGTRHVDQPELERGQDADRLVLLLQEPGEGEEELVLDAAADRPAVPLVVHVAALPARDVIGRLQAQARRLLGREVLVPAEPGLLDEAKRERAGRHRATGLTHMTPALEPAAGAANVTLNRDRLDRLVGARDRRADD